jgi:serine/threonine protein kinase
MTEDPVRNERINREVENMRRLPRHPNIILLIDSFSNNSYTAIVMEYFPSVDLLDFINYRKLLCFTENEAKCIFKQIVKAIAFMHEHNEVHRDIKPENILILDDRNEHGEYMIKVLDFGVSKYVGDGGSLLTSYAGTSMYIAPEIIQIANGYRNGKFNFRC